MFHKGGNNIEDKIISALSDYVHGYELLADSSVKDFIHEIEVGNINKESLSIAKIQLELRVGFIKAKRIYDFLSMKEYISKDKD